MLAPYRRVLTKPGAWQFSTAGLVARLPISVVPISIVLMVTAYYDSYALAGRVSAVFAIAQAVCAPQLAKLVDRIGQARVMRPSLAVSVVALSGLAVAALLSSPEAVLYLTTGIAGATTGAMGAMVRARWSLILTDADQVHTAYSLESVFDELVFVVGPVLATFLATTIHPVAGLAVAAGAAGCGGFWLLSQRATEPAPSGRPVGTERRSVMRQGSMVTVALVFVAVGLVFGGVDVTTIAFAEEQGLRSFAGVLLACLAVGSFSSGLLYGARSFVSPLWQRFLLGLVGLAVAASMLTFIDHVALVALALFAVGLGIGPTIITGNAVVQAVVPRVRLTEGLAWASTAIGVGFAGGMSLAGEVIERFDAGAGYLVVLAAGWLAVLIALAGLRVLRNQAHPAGPPATRS